MRRAGLVAGVLLLAGCDGPTKPAAEQGGAGAALEKTAIVAGIITDPSKLDPVGAYASDTDRVCIVPQRSGFRVGASVDYGEQQGCVARGTASGSETLHLEFGDGCSFDARVDGERIVFPAIVPPACDRRCTGRATLTAVSAGRLSNAVTEAQTMRAPDGQPLCG